MNPSEAPPEAPREAVSEQSSGSRRRARSRLDLLLVERGLFETREQARRAVMAGDVQVNGQRAGKPGFAVASDATLEVRSPPRFVSRGGLKLAQALDAFAIDPSGRTCLDVGASTGGFTDCLLQAGASQVYAVDVGYGQLHSRLREDERVHVLERVNARYLTPGQIAETPSLLVMDVSFISIAKLLTAVAQVLAPRADFVPLIKPQFEGRREQIGKGGIVRDQEVREEILSTSIDRICDQGFELVGRIDCDTVGAKGNREALAHFRFRGADRKTEVNA